MIDCDPSGLLTTVFVVVDTGTPPSSAGIAIASAITGVISAGI
jgi:hypothetical protein